MLRNFRRAASGSVSNRWVSTTILVISVFVWVLSRRETNPHLPLRCLVHLSVIGPTCGVIMTAVDRGSAITPLQREDCFIDGVLRSGSLLLLFAVFSHEVTLSLRVGSMSVVGSFFEVARRDRLPQPVRGESERQSNDCY